MDWSGYSLLPGCTTKALVGAVTICAILVLLGAGDHGTTRVWGPDPASGMDGTTMTEGAGGWPAAAFLSGLLSLGAMALTTAASLNDRRGFGAAPAAVAGSLLALTAVIAARQWRELLAERDRERDYVLTIAGGLPITVFAAAIGAALALALTCVMLIRWRHESSP